MKSNRKKEKIDILKYYTLIYIIMELALPLLALGGFYVISNQTNASHHNEQNNKKNYNNTNNNNSSKESFGNMKSRANQLPNTNIPTMNYPVTNNESLMDNLQEYPNPNKATDKYFNQNFYATKENAGVQVGSNIPQVYSLSGNYMETQQFKHNNMVPFNGGKVKGQLYNVNTTQTILDNMAGTGSQVIKKIEQAPLFKPQADMQWAYGAPNMSDFYQSRVVPGTMNNNVKPFESVNVGPGLNQGYGTSGSGGFNSGMESRDKWLPKTVDELRIATNPKQEYTLDNLQGPAMSNITNVGILGKVEKYTPDTFYMNTQDRWFTTVGAEKGNRLVAEEVLQHQNRDETSNYYAGSANSALKTSSYVPGASEAPKRAVLNSVDVPMSSAVRAGPHHDLENALKSHTNYSNNRSHNKQQDTFGSGFSSAIGAAIAPLMDMLKPSRKEEYVSNIRVYGNAESSVPGSGNYVINPYDITSTTVKETTLYSPNTFVGNQGNNPGGYTVAEQQAIANQRDSTNTNALNGVGGGAARYGDRNYDADYRQTNNESKEKSIVNHPNLGGTQIFNQHMNVNIAKLDSDRFSTGFGAPMSIIPSGPIKETYGKMHAPQYYNECAGCDRIQPDILSAFKENPYTHSLTYAV